MKNTDNFRLGIETLTSDHLEWIHGRRIGLVSHAAAIDRDGVTSATRLRQCVGRQLTALFGPEHGFAGKVAAGELTQHHTHADWDIPLFSLYAENKKPTPEMLEHVDILVVDFQDLGVRPYTYVSTLRLVLEAAAEYGKPVIVADRPVPLARQIDGPLLHPAFESFVGLIPAPMQYGMTPGETAQWLVSTLKLDVGVRVAAMRGYHRDPERLPTWPPWVPPSPRIRSWESACLFSCTVFGEALPALDYGSGTNQAFQLLGAPWLDASSLLSRFPSGTLPGLAMHPTRYHAATGAYAGMELDGVRLQITDYIAFRPLTVAITLLAAIQSDYGIPPLWDAPGTRPEWFDKLFGTSAVRESLLRGTPATAIVDSWQSDLAAFSIIRNNQLLYHPL